MSKKKKKKKTEYRMIVKYPDSTMRYLKRDPEHALNGFRDTEAHHERLLDEVYLEDSVARRRIEQTEVWIETRKVSAWTRTSLQ